MFCGKCGAQISEDTRLCPECGEMVSENQTDRKIVNENTERNNTMSGNISDDAAKSQNHPQPVLVALIVIQEICMSQQKIIQHQAAADTVAEKDA